MPDTPTSKPSGTTVTTGSGENGEPKVVVRVESAGPRGGWLLRLAILGLIISIIANVSMYSAYSDYFAGTKPPLERYHSGSRTAATRIAVIEVVGTIMPPYTERYLAMIERAAKDDDVKGVLLVVDSPGGLVADSHQIYHALTKLREETQKPVFVSMKRMAASGGLYIAMAAGPDGTIFAEPTTWTGSIGVIVPHYDLSGFAEQHGIAGTNPALKTGELKDSLSPLRPLSEKDEEVWRAILDDAFQEFIGVIADNRDTLDRDQVKTLATGQIYTTKQARANGLVDEVGYEEDALAALLKKAEVDPDDTRVVTYYYESTLLDVVLGTAEATSPEETWRTAMESTVPRAMFYCSWAPFYAGR